MKTGVVSRDPGNGYRVNHLPPSIEMFQGWCLYPKSSRWTWPGSETRVSNTLVNCSSASTLNQTLQVSGSTTSTTTSSVKISVGIKWTALEKVLELSAGAEYSYSWSYAKSAGWATTTGITVPPKRVGRLAMRPVMRTVRSNPVFYVERYTWGNPDGSQTSVNSWRGRGYAQITSRGAYYDAAGDVLNSDGTPKGQYVARDRAVTSADRC